jgi:hypothetical protein
LLTLISPSAPEIDIKNFERVMKVHPYFPEFISALKEEDSLEVFEEFVSKVGHSFLMHICTYLVYISPKMLEAMCDARAQDSNSIKSEIISFIPVDWQRVAPPAHPGANKGDRGFNNIATGEKLCPLRYLPQFRADPM